mgnify:FL=1
MTTRLQLVAYVPWPNSQTPFRSKRFWAADQEHLARQTCSNCGHKGLRAEAYEAAGSLRAWAVCPQCGVTREF